jgi:hypothetical protein
LLERFAPHGNPKSQVLNPKQARNSNEGMTETVSARGPVFGPFGLSCFGFVPNFALGISDFPRRSELRE